MVFSLTSSRSSLPRTDLGWVVLIQGRAARCEPLTNCIAAFSSSCKKRLFFQLFLRSSRACLGNTILFRSKRFQKRRISARTASSIASQTVQVRDVWKGQYVAS
jgi:hypothetical protein